MSLGVVGIVFDKTKWLAVAVGIVSGGLVYFFFVVPFLSARFC